MFQGSTAHGPRTSVVSGSPLLWQRRFGRQVALYPQHTDDPGQTWLSGYSTPSKAKQLPALLTEKKNGSRNE